MFRYSFVGKMWGVVLSILLVPLITNLSVKADAAPGWQKKFLGFLADCRQEYNLTYKDLEALKDMKMSDNEDVKCYFACTFKKAEMMNEKGEFSEEGVRKSSLEHYGNDEAIVKKIEEFIEICKKVNDVPVTDGEKGCQRAALMFQCSQEHARQLGLS